MNRNCLKCRSALTTGSYRLKITPLVQTPGHIVAMSDTAPQLECEFWLCQQCVLMEPLDIGELMSMDEEPEPPPINDAVDAMAYAVESAKLMDAPQHPEQVEDLRKLKELQAKHEGTT